jgi:hypothetical protein
VRRQIKRYASSIRDWLLGDGLLGDWLPVCNKSTIEEKAGLLLGKDPGCRE